MPQNNYPKLHNAMWPGLVGKGSPGAEPFIELDTMLDMTAKAEVGGVKFDGVDLFLYNPHTDIDISDDGIKALAAKIKAKNLVVAPVWFDASAGGDEKARANFVTHVRKAVRIAGNFASSVSAPTALSASTAPRASRHGTRTPKPSPNSSLRPSVRPARSRRAKASASRPKARSAGAACTRGRIW